MKIKEVFKKYKSEFYLTLLVIYAVILLLGAISEVFDLGWFRWLGPW
jgi:hypothetical protein